jgi:acyl-CoA synthetase (AMP-forming)/AMP-acid ligase II
MWKTGIVMVPLNTRDSATQNIEILIDSEATAIVFGADFMEQIEQFRQNVPHIREYICHGDPSGLYEDYESILVGSNPSEPNFEFDENDIYRIHYTSGTTGKPRGVIMTYRNRMEQIAHVFMNADRLISKDDVFLHVAPLTHAAGYYSTPYYLKGAKHVILDRFDPTRLFETIEKEKVTCILLVPTMIVMLLEQENIRNYNMQSLKRIFYGTAPMPTSKLREAVAIFGNVFRQNYGLTEAVQPLACLTPEEHVLDGEQEVVARLGSAGSRAIGLEIRIVDENDADVPLGQIGEILLRSPHISPGYLNLSEATEETYKGGWLHTGDLGRQDQGGYLYIIDRKKDMIISGGFNIYSREVEIFVDSHPAVLESAVIGVADEKWGEVVKAIVVLKKVKTKPAEQELIDFCLNRGLSKYKAPKIIRFVDRLPKNENGKIIKKDLKGV